MTLALLPTYAVEDRGLPWALWVPSRSWAAPGPLYGAVVLAGHRRHLFINLAVGLVLAAAIRTLNARGRTTDPATSPPSRHVDLYRTGSARSPSARWSCRHPATGFDHQRLAGCAIRALRDEYPIWWSPLGLVAGLVALIFVGWKASGGGRATDQPTKLDRPARQADLVGATLIKTVMLGGIILAFASADPAVAVFSPIGPWLLAVSALSGVLLVWHNRRAKAPLVPRGALRRTPAWGALVISFFVGAALIAALTDIPVFARLSALNADQMGCTCADRVFDRPADRCRARRLVDPFCAPVVANWRWHGLGWRRLRVGWPTGVMTPSSTGTPPCTWQ
ncbi:MAG: hypothetical protein R2709_15575 [Marmoricola sp.]